MADQNNAPEMPDRIWAVSWFSRPDAGIWQENEPGSDQNAVEFIRADRAAPEGQCYFGPIGIPHWSSALTPPPAVPTDNTALVEALRDARIQLAYVNEKQPRGTTTAAIARLDAALASREAPPACQQEAVTVAEAAQVLLNAQIYPSNVNWQSVWDAMREDAKDGDLPMAFNKALRALKGDNNV